jgi:hypothetical protein
MFRNNKWLLTKSTVSDADATGITVKTFQVLEAVDARKLTYTFSISIYLVPVLS